jgi:hypothetical protein
VGGARVPLGRGAPCAQPPGRDQQGPEALLGGGGGRPAGAPVEGVISDGPHAIRKAVGSALPAAPHQVCQFHYLREAAKEVYEADRHAKKELKKRVRGVRPIERELEGRNDPESEAVREYCLALRSAITDDGRPRSRLRGSSLMSGSRPSTTPSKG